MADVVGISWSTVRFINVLEVVDTVCFYQGLDHNIRRLFIIVITAVVVTVIWKQASVIKLCM